MDKTRFQTDAEVIAAPVRRGRMTNLAADASGKAQGTRFLSPGAPVSAGRDKPQRGKSRKRR